MKCCDYNSCEACKWYSINKFKNTPFCNQWQIFLIDSEPCSEFLLDEKKVN